MKQNKIIIFGAGRIGRSFIGQLFSQGGYELIFIDIDENIIRLLNKHKSYKVVIRDEQEEIIRVENISAILLPETAQVPEILITAKLVAVCVGNAGLPGVARIIARTIMEKEKRKNYFPLDIILAENLRNAAEIFCRMVSENLPAGYDVRKNIGLVETSIGKMVPMMPPGLVVKDPLMIYAEAYNDLIVDAGAFKNEIPKIRGLMPKQNMKAWVDRKLFIHNLGHAASAYFGNYYLPSKTYIWEVLENELIRTKVEETMNEAGAVLQRIHPGEFPPEHLNEHITDLIRRFRNRSLGDTIYRVGCDLKRKLDHDDRLVAPLRIAYENKLPYRNILSALKCGCFFSASGFEGRRLDDDEAVLDDFKNNGISCILEKYCKLKPREYPGIFTDAQNLELKPDS
jgi:mannitol-1-phosphate 5-dehydrogenase